MKNDHSRLFWALSDSWVLTKRGVKHIIRNPDQLISVVLFPIMFLLLFRYVFGGAINTGPVNYVNFLVAGILVQNLAFGANNTTINLAVDLQRGVVDRFKSLPMASSALLVAHVAADLVRNAIAGAIILIVGFLVGFRPSATPIEWILVISLAFLFTFAISWLSAILGLFVRNVRPRSGLASSLFSRSRLRAAHSFQQTQCRPRCASLQRISLSRK